MRKPLWLISLVLVGLIIMFIYEMAPILRAINNRTFSSVELIEVIYWAVIWGVLITFWLKRGKKTE